MKLATKNMEAFGGKKVLVSKINMSIKKKKNTNP